MKVTVTQGTVYVETLDLVYRTPDCFVIEGDLRAKRGDVLDIELPTVFLDANAETTGWEYDAAGPTEIAFEDLPEGFSLYAVISRYTLLLYGYASAEARRKAEEALVDGDRPGRLPLFIADPPAPPDGTIPDSL